MVSLVRTDKSSYVRVQGILDDKHVDSCPLALCQELYWPGHWQIESVEKWSIAFRCVNLQVGLIIEISSPAPKW